MQQDVTQGESESVARVRQALAARLGAERCAVWFGRGVAFEVHEAALLVRVGDSFRLDHMRRSLRRELSAAAHAALGDGASVEFVYDAAAAPPPRGALPAKAEQPAAVASADNTAGISTEPSSPKPHPRPFASLSDFVVGVGNQVAHASVQSILARPGMYSPLTLVGPPGCGKTHLLEGIWRHVRTSVERTPSTVRRVIYLSAEQFTNQFVEALKHSGTPNFRRKYRDVEMLLIDDVQFFAGKQSTVVELVHTIDTLLREGRQLVFTADRPPVELGPVGPELVARLSGGLVCTMQPADAATRLKILEQLAARQPAPIPAGVLTWLAGELTGDARHLAGAIHRLVAGSGAFGRPIDLDFAQRELADLVHAARRPVRVPDIVEAVCEVFGVGAEQLQSSSKSPGVTLPRMLVMFLARKYTRAALSEIGRVLGRRSHSTVVSAQHKVSQWLTEGKRVPLGLGECSLEDALRRVESQLRLA